MRMMGTAIRVPYGVATKHIVARRTRTRTKDIHKVESIVLTSDMETDK